MAIRPIDLAVVLLYLLGVTAFGMRFRRGGRSLKTYFLGESNVPWWAISLSIVAAETSTLTLVSVPGLAYQGNFAFLQLALGFIVGRVVISFTLLPQYFRREIFTAYEWIAHRFGNRLRRMTAGVFLLTRAAAEGVRVFAVAIVVGMALALPSSFSGDAAAIGLVVVLTLLYTYHGGLNAVIWTDVLQITIYTLGSLVGLISLMHSVPGGWAGFLHAGFASGKFRILDFTPGFSHPYTFLAGLIGGTFLTTASHGTDQLMVQRLLAARDEKKARRALIVSGFVVFAQFAFYLGIGAALFFADRARGTVAPVDPDRIFPQFIVHGLPAGMTGLLIAAILAAAMSNLSAALNSLSSTSVMDFYREFFPFRDEKSLLRLAQLSTLGWAAVLFGIALLARHGGRVVEMGLSIASVAYGALLGVFLTGWFNARIGAWIGERTSRPIGENATIVGMLVGFVFNLFIWKATPIAFPWYVPMGCLVTFASAALLSRFSPVSASEALATRPTDAR